jgi:nitrate reductase alpha subunit
MGWEPGDATFEEDRGTREHHPRRGADRDTASARRLLKEVSICAVGAALVIVLELRAQRLRELPQVSAHDVRPHNERLRPVLQRQLARIGARAAPFALAELRVPRNDGQDARVGHVDANGSLAVADRLAALGRQPRRLLNSPCWTGIVDAGRTYTAYALNVERLVPWRTLTGRQHLYLDHPGQLAHGEALPTYKPRCDPSFLQDLVRTVSDGHSIRLNYLTPHGKWNIHSTYGDNLRMLTLSRGLHPLWVSEGDAAKLGIADNDWVEVVNDHGVVVTRAVIGIPSPERPSALSPSALR